MPLSTISLASPASPASPVSPNSIVSLTPPSDLINEAIQRLRHDLDYGLSLRVCDNVTKISCYYEYERLDGFENVSSILSKYLLEDDWDNEGISLIFFQSYPDRQDPRIVRFVIVSEIMAIKDLILDKKNHATLYLNIGKSLIRISATIVPH